MENNSSRFLFTSEYVSEGHPDKLCDIISDAILDAHLREDPDSMVACEVSAKNKTIFVFGEVTSKATIQVKDVVIDVIKEVGHYEGEEDSLNIIVELDRQSPEIAASLHVDDETKQGAGDQGMMFGYACDESEEQLPLSLTLSRELISRLTALRKGLGCEKVPWLLPDAKTQVTMEYQQNHEKREPEPVGVHSVVVSTQHRPAVSLEEIRRFLKEEVVQKVIPPHFLLPSTQLFLNHTGSFVNGGPIADAGLTGRKIIVDTYGGWGSHGGGAFSGKDASKVDRSGAYFARFIAKSLVHSGICRRVLVQIAYCIGYAEPLSVFVDSYGTGCLNDREIEQLVTERFDMRPGSMIKQLELKKPQFKKAAQFGHFGWANGEFAWEKPVQIDLK